MKPASLTALIVILLIPLIALIVFKKNDSTTASSSSPTPNPTATPAQSQSVQNASQLKDPADAVSASQVRLKTSLGDIVLDLYPVDAPKTVANFVTLGKRGYYTGVIFHRVIKDFVIQGGDPLGTGTGGESIYGKTFPDEINSHKIVQGTLAMANAGPNTNGSQFYIVTKSAQPSLDGSYTVFGQVADAASQAVVDAIAAVPVTNERPNQDVKITGMDILKP